MAKNWQPGDRAVYKGQQVHILECGTAVGTLENENGRRIDGVFLEDLRPIGTLPRLVREKAEIEAMEPPPPFVD